MCEQCLVNPIYFGDVLPGWLLARARREVEWADWKKGEWGLIKSNDPTFRWTTTPTPNPTWGMSEKEEDDWIEAQPDGSPEKVRAEFLGFEGDFHEQFSSCTAMEGYRLVSAAIEKGYDPAVHGGFAYWFFDFIGEFLKTAEPLEDEHPGAFPKMEDDMPSDLTIGRDPIPGELFYAV